MDTLPFLDIITFFAYIALAVDLVLEIRKVRARQHSDDISLLGIAVRTSAATVILIKLFVVNDYVLIVGQAMLIALLIAYLVLIYRFRSRV